MELHGVAFPADEATSREMAECFIEEFLMLGYGPGQLLALFRNPHYLGLNLVLRDRGEPFVRDAIREVLARWGVEVEWPSAGSTSTLKPHHEPDPPPLPASGHPLPCSQRGTGQGEGAPVGSGARDTSTLQPFNPSTPK